MQKEEWLLCPICGNKTRLKIREDTEIEKFVKALDDAGYQDILNAKQEQLDAWVAQQK